MNIQTRYEKKRGCGYRKSGGIYLMGDGVSKPCAKLPIQLSVCAHCGQGMKQSRGFTWLSDDFLRESPCSKIESKCQSCYPLCGQEEKVLLMWVGKKFYPSVEDFKLEAASMGISKRIPHLPKDFKVGKSWVLLAHPEATDNDPPEPGIFMCFKPNAIEYVVKGTETESELESIEARGINLVKVIPEHKKQLSAL